MKDEKKQNPHKKLISIAVSFVLTLVLVAVFFYAYFSMPSEPKAAIIDQLSNSKLSPISRHQNQTFIDLAKQSLYKRFPKVDYFSDNATVNQYRHLSSLGYKFILWRAHSALNVKSSYVAISSSERYFRYSQDYGSLIDNGQITGCNITGDPYLYFAITPDFVKNVMNGRFEDTIIVFMSCNGLKAEYLKTAQSFIEKGAKAFISWDGWIDKLDNDNGITFFLDYLINANDTIAQAVSKTPSYLSTEFGPSKLGYYPKNADVGSFKIPNYRRDTVSGNGGFVLFIAPATRSCRKISTY